MNFDGSFMQALPIIGAVVAFALSVAHSLINGYNEKQEGKREERAKIEKQNQARDAKIRKDAENVKDTSRAVDINHQRMRKQSTPLPDYHYRD